jgi:hypothetical protein
MSALAISLAGCGDHSRLARLAGLPPNAPLDHLREALDTRFPDGTSYSAVQEAVRQTHPAEIDSIDARREPGPYWSAQFAEDRICVASKRWHHYMGRNVFYVTFRFANDWVVGRDIDHWVFGLP